MDKTENQKMAGRYYKWGLLSILKRKYSEKDALTIGTI